MSTILHTASGVVGNVGNQLQHTTSRVGTQLQNTTNRYLPPHQREQLAQRLRVFANRNPKLAAFLAVQVALTGLPFILFLAFATTTLLVSLTTCLLIGLLASLAFTFFVVGVALLFVVPTVFFASCAASFIFIWGFVGYIILRRLNEGEALDKRGTRVGDRLQGLTGGRVGRLGLWAGQGASDGTDGQTSVAKGQAGFDRGGDHRGPPHQENDGYVNGLNGTHEWEDKWTNGVGKEQQGLENGNPYEVLKVEERVHDAVTEA
ncbi:hypothetical protein BKA66DRAFT_574476 [Pyrenochaeta sp. MPI-SDFR-AT-0127]|nr:hypothetical protein BKA66DRAFT_574476 [Pyrenochaeta sp. MPI-SDFR-AT-0127]